MRPRRALPLLTAVFGAALLLACGKQSEPAPSGGSPGTPPPAAGATEAPKAAATARPPEQVEALLLKALLQRADVPGAGWTVQETGMREMAAARSASAQQGGQAAQDFVTACYPNQPAAGSNPSDEAVMRYFALSGGLTSVLSLVSRSADAQRTVKAAQDTRAGDMRSCMQAGLQKSISAQLPGATIEVVQLTNITGLPANAGGIDAVFRISASGVNLIQHVASVSAAQGDVLSTTIIIAMAPGAATPPLPAPPAQLGALAVQRLAEALR